MADVAPQNRAPALAGRHARWRRALPSRRWAVRLAVAAAVVGWLAWFFRPLHVAKPFVPPQRKADLTEFASRVRGVVVYQRESANKPEAIYKTVIGRGRAWRLADDGRYPRWSPDGRHIAYFRGSDVMLMTAGGRFQRRLARTTDPSPRALAFHPGGSEVWFTDGADLKAVDVRTRKVRIVLSGLPFRALDVSPDGRRLVVAISGHRILRIELPSGNRVGRIETGCSAVLSPDATLCTHNQPMHKGMYVRRWDDWSLVGEFRAPAGMTFDNEAWSNDPRWIVTRTEQPNNQNCYVHDPRAERPVQITFTGDCNRPDLFIQTGPYGWKQRIADWMMERLRL